MNKFNFKSLVAVLLTVLMVFSIVPMFAVSAEETTVTFDFSSLTGKGTEIISSAALTTFKGCASDASYLTAVTTSKIYNGNGTSGLKPNSTGFIKTGSSKANGELTMTFTEKVTKVELVCHAWTTSGNDTVSVNGGASQKAPTNGDITEKLTFEIDASETVTIVTAKRAFIKSITVYMASTEGGSTEPTPIFGENVTVNTADELLQYVAEANAATAADENATAGKTLTIGADIDLTGKTWVPLTRWVGTLEGNGKTISGINYTDNTTTSNVGIIANIVANGNNIKGTIQNLTLKNCSVSSTSAEKVGALTGMTDRGRLLNNTIENCTVTGTQKVGALAGRTSYASDDVDGVATLILTGNKVISCTVTGDAAYTGAMIGLIRSDNYTYDISNTYVYITTVNGTVASTEEDVYGAYESAVLKAENVTVIAEEEAPSIPLTNGMQVVIYNPANNKALSSQPASAGSYYQKGVNVTLADGKLTGFADTEVWTVVVNEDGTYSFEQGGKKIAMQDSYSSMSLGAANDKWEVTEVGEGLYTIKNVKRGKYMEWYKSMNNWSTHSNGKEATDPLFQLAFFEVVTEAACEHKNTETVGAKEATETEEGYTGDTVCKDCGETIATGEKIPVKTPEACTHANTETVGAKDATFTEEGYTGDTVCKDCGETIATGEKIPVKTPDVSDGDTVAAPEAGVPYKFGMIQGNVGKTFYLKGGMNGYYMDTTDNIDDAIDVYLEKTEGGYYLYTMVDGAKTYINMVVSGTHVNGAYEATASTVYTWDAEHGTLISVVDGKDYWFGTRNDKNYTTVGPCATSYNGFYCQFYPSDTVVEPAPTGDVMIVVVAGVLLAGAALALISRKRRFN